MEDHFAFLMVGPALIFAMREAIFTQAKIEDEICQAPRDIRELMEKLMLANLDDCQKYYPGSPAEQQLNVNSALAAASVIIKLRLRLVRL